MYRCFAAFLVLKKGGANGTVTTLRNRGWVGELRKELSAPWQ